MRTAEQKKDIRERFLNVDAANVADILDEMGYVDQGLAGGFQRQNGWLGLHH